MDNVSIANIKHEYINGISIKKLARKYNVTEYYIRKLIKERLDII